MRRRRRDKRRITRSERGEGTERCESIRGEEIKTKEEEEDSAQYRYMLELLTTDDWFQLSSDGQSLPNWRIDKVQEIVVRATGVQISCFGRVHHRPSPYCQEPIKLSCFGKCSSLLEAIGRDGRNQEHHTTLLTQWN